MADRGRPRLSVEVKKQQGTYRPSREKGVPQNYEVLTKAPAPLPGMSDEAQKMWAVLAEQLVRMGAMQMSDVFMLAALCETWAAMNQAGRDASEVGRYYTMKDDKGHPKCHMVHPAHTVHAGLLRDFVMLCNQFGFSPAARQKLHMQASAPPPKSPMDGLLKNR